LDLRRKIQNCGNQFCEFETFSFQFFKIISKISGLIFWSNIIQLDFATHCTSNVECHGQKSKLEEVEHMFYDVKWATIFRYGLFHAQAANQALFITLAP
jgi:hypothetical protein